MTVPAPRDRRPGVAAVTINFGAPFDTLECVRSLVATGYEPLRIIVVDNGSAEEHRQRLKRDLPAGVELIESPVNLGFGGGNNLGITRALEAGADYVLLINNDATLAPPAINALSEAAPHLAPLGILGGKIVIATANGPTGQIWSAGGRWSPLRGTAYLRGLGERDQGQYDRAQDTEFIPGCLWFVPAAVFRKVGLLPESFFLYAEDLDYCLDITKAGYRIVYEPRAVCYHKVSRSHWGNRERASPVLNYYTNRNRVLIARKWLNPVQRAAFHVYLATSRLALALLRRDRSYLAGLWDGLRGRTGPRGERER